MRKWIVGMLVLLTILLLTGLTQTANAYQPLTKPEVEEWLGSITFDELIDFIIKYDYVENTDPEISGGDFIVVLSGRDVYIEYQSKMKVKIGHLEYNFEMEDKVYEDFVPKTKMLKAIGISSGAGLLTGIILILLIL